MTDVKTSASYAYRLLRRQPMPGIAFLKDADGSIHTHTSQLDRIMREAWSPIYQGAGDYDRKAVEFCCKYREYLVEGPPINTPAIDTKWVLRAFTHAKATAGGIDGWRPAELMNMPPIAAKHLARILRSIEQGSKWPEALTNALCVYIGKPKHQNDDPRAFRGLLILSAAYRTWARARLHDMEPHLQGSFNDDVFAGRRGRGANDAWHTMAVVSEAARLRGDPQAMLMFDLYKAFDQINRSLIYCLMLLAGIPWSVVLPYATHMEALRIVPAFHTGCRMPASRPASIPQGCPFSML
eukprot:15437975-Alexandrium_andersonii.AAC.1